MRLLVATVLFLAVAPAARADHLLFSTDRVPTPTHVLRLGIDGHGARVLTAGPALAVHGSEVVTASDRTLLLDGKALATVGWPVDAAAISPDGSEIAFTDISLVNCAGGGTNCATWELWLVGSDGTGLRELTSDGRFPVFSPDGRRLAFVGGYTPLNDGGTAVAQDLATGKRAWFGYTSGRVVWGPRSDRIAYTSYGRVVVARWSPRRITRVARGTDPVFWPGGQALAYFTPNGLTVGGKVIGPHAEPGAVWTPSGWLLYVRRTAAYPLNYELVRVRPDGSHAAVIRRRTPTTIFDWVQWDDGSIVLQTTQTRYSLAVIESLDLATGRILRGPLDAGADLSPTVGPGGELAYAKGSSTRWAWFCLAVGSTCVTTAKTVDGIRDPAWSPAGTEVAAIDYRGHGECDLVLADRTGVTRIVHAFHGITESPSWSPDGRSIVLANAGDSPDGHMHLWRVDVATGSAAELDTGAFALAPSWSPDGSTIAFYGDAWGGFALEYYDVATGVVKVAAVLGLNPVESRPAWSPDAQRIAYQAENGSVRVMNRDGTGDHQVLDWAMPGSALAWAP